MIKTKTKARPRFKCNTVSFSVVVPVTAYEALDNAPGEQTWRQHAQEAIKQYAATLSKKEAPETTEVASA